MSKDHLVSTAGTCGAVIAWRSTAQKVVFVLVLVGDPLADGAQVVAQVQVAGRLHARQDALPHRRLAIGATTGAVVRATALPAVADDMVSGGSGIGYE